MERKNVVVAIDIGTTKIFTIIAEIEKETGEFNIIGSGISQSMGLSKGVVVDVDQVTKDIDNSLKNAQHMAGVEVKAAFIGVAGRHIESLISHAATIVGKTPKEITIHDKEKLENIAENKVVPVERKVIHKIVYNYRIDDSEIVKNPIGMKGIKLEADVHIVTGVVNAIQALMKSTNNLGIDVDDVVLEPLASAKAILTSTEKKLGSIMVDIGGGTTDIAIFKDEKLIYTSVIPLGGEHFTKDIASILKVDLRVAGRLKKEFSLNCDEIDLEEIIEIPSYNSFERKEIKLEFLKEIIDSRIDDVLEHVSAKIEASGVKHLIPNGIVFTGGASKIAGLREKAETYFDMDVRFGTPVIRRGIPENMNKPEDSTGVGLLLYGVEKYLSGSFSPMEKKKYESDFNLVEVIKEKMKSWFEMLF